jgi:hypothetical protein
VVYVRDFLEKTSGDEVPQWKFNFNIHIYSENIQYLLSYLKKYILCTIETITMIKRTYQYIFLG